MTTRKTIKKADWEKEFDKNRPTMGPINSNGEGAINFFGYKYQELDEIHEVTDWGNIKNFIRSHLAQQREEILDKVEESNQNEYDNGFEDGIDRTIKEVDKVLDWKQWEKDLIKANVSSTLLNLYRSANKELNKRLNKVKLR